MTPIRFDLPIRLVWAVPPGVSRETAAAVREAAPLEMSLEAKSAADLLPLGLPWDGVFAAAAVREWEGVPFPPGVDRWEIPVQGAEEARRVTAALAGRLPPGTGALRFLPEAGGLRELLGVIEAAREAAWGQGWALVLPSRPAEGVRRGHLPGIAELPPAEWERLRAAVRAMGEGRALVHDFFLARAMGMGPSEVAGCEAADALAYLDEEGAVHPCPSLLVRMGNLAGEGMAAIWEKPLRRRIRRDIATVPPVCGACPDCAACKGGCRGLAYQVAGHFRAPDPQCPRS